MAEYKRLERNLIRKGVIFDYYQDQILIPNGNVATWDFIKHKGAAAVLAIREDGMIPMVKQYRNAIDRYTLEIPAGGLNGVDEPTEIAAARELEEETGYKSDDLELLISIYTTVAFCNEKIDIYLARNLKESSQHLDDDEFLQVEYHRIEDLVAMVHAGKIQDAKTVSAIMTYYSKVRKL